MQPAQPGSGFQQPKRGASYGPGTFGGNEAELALVSGPTGLTRLTPEIPLISEECTQLPYETRKDWNTFWLTDPLDGTPLTYNKPDLLNPWFICQ